MRTFIGYKMVPAAIIATALAAVALTAQAQVSVQTSVSGSVGEGSNGSANAGMKARVSDDSDSGNLRVRASTTPNASANAVLHADENSAVIRGNDRQNDREATTSVEVSSTDRDSGTSRKMTARFLGIFPASITAHIVVDADGREEVRYPWYAFLFKLVTNAQAGVDADASSTASVR